MSTKTLSACPFPESHSSNAFRGSSDEEKSSGKCHVPLVVDLDGTLTPTDTLVESLIELVRHSPLNLMCLPLWLLKGRARFKEAIAKRIRIVPEHFPYNEPLVAYLREEKAKGRRIV